MFCRSFCGVFFFLDIHGLFKFYFFHLPHMPFLSFPFFLRPVTTSGTLNTHHQGWHQLSIFQGFLVSDWDTAFNSKFSENTELDRHLGNNLTFSYIRLNKFLAYTPTRGMCPREIQAYYCMKTHANLIHNWPRLKISHVHKQEEE